MLSSSMKFQLLIKLRYRKIRTYHVFKPSDDVSMLVNVKMSTIGWHLNIYEHDEFHAQLS